MSVSTASIKAGGYEFFCRTSGDSGEPVVLMHGFPETSHMWIPLMQHLAAAGYRCLAPDQRGYSPGARPAGADKYHYDELAKDVFALADSQGFERFHLIGHDHGAGLGWNIAARFADRIGSYTAMSVPHIAAFASAIRNNDDQKQRSQYIGFFQQPGAAEQALSADDFSALKAVWNKSDDAERDEYLRVFRQQGALTGALNWYRGTGNLDNDNARRVVGKVSVPTILIWGNQDNAIGREGVEKTPEFMTGPYRLIELDVGHWLVQEAADTVNREVLAHLRANPLK